MRLEQRVNLRVEGPPTNERALVATQDGPRLSTDPRAYTAACVLCDDGRAVQTLICATARA